MNPHSIRVLEFDQIVERLHDLCWSMPAKRCAVTPSGSLDKIEHSLDCLSEMVEIYEADGGPPSLVFEDIDFMLEKSAAEGKIFEPTELVKVAGLYELTADFIKLNDKYLNLKKLTSNLIYSEEVVSGINQAIQPPGEIKDNATPELKSIRRQIRKTRTMLEAKYNSYLESDYSKYLSDNIVTVRDGRFVLPVREGEKGRIKGVVHDRSSTGATFFIEPFEAVELNNSLRELLAAEKSEIYRILRSLTDIVLERLESIKNNIKILTTLDIYSAKARLALKLKCSRPELNDQNIINIKKGYHPLLRWRDMENDSDNTIPLDIELGDEFTTIVITGPNTGGKTVAIKTVGLICLMAQSGMFVPAGEGSTVPVFKDIYADIGDEQSLEASLSTFSAHLNNIKTALDMATEECLVLLDEIGAGTDPDEGAALGQAIIERLTERGIPTIITTHHGKLKTLAVNIKGVQNGSLDFDTQNMKPVYRFRMGVPGLSYAIETARKLGLDESVTKRAGSLIDRSERKLAGIISELSDKLRKTEETLFRAEEKKISYEALVSIYAEKLDGFEKEKKQIKKEAFKKAEDMVRESKAEIERLIKDAKKADQKIEALREVKRTTDEKILDIKKQAKQYEPPINRAAAFGEVGEQVYLPEMNASGEIVEKPDSNGKVRVRIGNVILHTELRRLYKAAEKDKPQQHYLKQTAFDEVSPEMEIDLRGMTFDEAQPVLDRYLEDVYRARFDNVTVIHGKGTGALKMKIQNHLKNHHRVKSFRLGYWNEGSYGVTIVEINKD